MHLHGFSFCVLSRNVQPTRYREWLDRVLVDPNETVEVALAVGEFRGQARAKVRLRADGSPPGLADVFPEFDDVAAVARATGRPLRELDVRVRQLVLERLEGGAG